MNLGRITQDHSLLARVRVLSSASRNATLQCRFLERGGVFQGTGEESLACLEICFDPTRAPNFTVHVELLAERCCLDASLAPDSWRNTGSYDRLISD